MSEVKETAVAAPATAPAPKEKPQLGQSVVKFAAYITRDNYKDTWCKTKHNEDIIKGKGHLASLMFARMHDRHPSLTPDQNDFCLNTAAGQQLLILVRMFYVSAVAGKLGDIADVKDMASAFKPDTMDSYLWRWFTSVVAFTGDSWEMHKGMAIGDSVAAITKYYEKLDPTCVHLDVAAVAVSVLFDVLVSMTVEVCSPDIDCKGSKKVTIDESTFNGWLRLLNSKSAKPIADSFFIDLYHCASQLKCTKKFWDDELKALTPPKEKKVAAPKKPAAKK
jgi:hypothetical protein